MIFIIRANHDLTTYYLYVWTNDLIKEAQERNFKVTLIEEDDIQEIKIRSRISNNRPRLIFFNGHGDSASLLNNKGQECVNIKSCDMLKDIIIFARACDSLGHLGVAAIGKGCEAFIGYNKKFWIPRNHNYESTPKRDSVAKPVIECSNIIFQELIRGKTVAESVYRSHHDKAAEHILGLIYSNDPLASPCLQALIINDEALGFVGNASATIT